jgi:hypothetical protein
VTNLANLDATFESKFLETAPDVDDLGLTVTVFYSIAGAEVLRLSPPPCELISIRWSCQIENDFFFRLSEPGWFKAAVPNPIDLFLFWLKAYHETRYEDSLWPST